MISQLLERVQPFKVELKTTFRAVNHRVGFIIKGEYGYGEWAPFSDYEPPAAAKWLQAALEAADQPRRELVRSAIPVNGIVPALPPQQAIAWCDELVSNYQVEVLKIKVGDADQLQRVAAVKQEFPDVEIRVDANGAYSHQEALTLIKEFAHLGVAAIEQPCATLEENRGLKGNGVLIALDESIRLANLITDSLVEQIREVADIAVLKPIPLGGSSNTIDLATRIDLPVIVSGSLDTSIGLSFVSYVAALLPKPVLASGLGTSVLLAQDLISPSLLPKHGFISIEPIEPNPDLLNEATNRISSVELAELTDRLKLAAAHLGEIK